MKSHLIIIIFLLNIQKITGQSLIAGIPSADVAEKDHIEITHESQFGNQGKWNSFNIFCLGLSHHTEFTATYNNLSNQRNSNQGFSMGLKTVFPLYKDSSKSELKWTMGGNYIYSTYLKQHGYWIYSHASFRLPGLKTRITCGGSASNRALTGESSTMPFHMLAGFEQPLNKHFSVIGDWFSGKHDLGALITGIQWDFGKNVLIAGLKLPNDKTAPALILEGMFSIPYR